MKFRFAICFFVLIIATHAAIACDPGKLLFVVERSSSSLLVIDISTLKPIRRVKVKGDLHHATMTFDPWLRYGYLATRNGYLSRISLKDLKEDGVIKTSDNSIGLAISEDGRTLAVSEYMPGGVTFIDLSTFAIQKKISTKGKESASRVTGLVDAPKDLFIAALMDSGKIWIMGKKKGGKGYSMLYSLKAAASDPFDALITPEGRYYLAGHIKSRIVSMVDLWSSPPKVRSISLSPAKPDTERLPVKMPHMEMWGTTKNKVFVPLVGEHSLAVLSYGEFNRIGNISLIGDPVYAVVHPGQREIWVTFSGKEDGKIQVIDTQTYKTLAVMDVGKRIYHLTFEPRGFRAYASSNKTNEVVVINASDYKVIKRIRASSPSGIFGVWRAFQIGL